MKITITNNASLPNRRNYTTSARVTINVLTCVVLIFNLVSCATTMVPRRDASESELLSAIDRNDPNAYLLVNRANSNAAFRPDWRAIHAATFDLDERLVRSLVENGADLNIKGRPRYGGVLGTPIEYGKPETPAEIAVRRNNRELGAYLTQHSGENMNRIVSAEENFRSRAKAKKKIEDERYRALAQQQAEQRRRDAENRGIPEYRTCSYCRGTGLSNGDPLIMLPCGTCWGSGRLRNY